MLQGAQGLALKNKNQHFSPEHLLKALLDDDQKLTVNLIKAAGGRPDVAADLTERALTALPKVESATGQLYLAPKTAEVFTTAEEAAKKAGDSFVTVERLLLALAIEKSASTAKTLADAGVTPNGLNAAINEIRKGRTADSDAAEDSYEALSKFTTDVTDAARRGKLDPVSRARGRGPPHHPDSGAPHQEQPGADRPARRRQDRDCRRAGTAYRQW